MKITCDSCNEVLSAPEKLYGKKVSCPICECSIDVPKVVDDGSISNIRRYKISETNVSGSARKKVNYDLIGNGSNRKKKSTDRKKSKYRRNETVAIEPRDHRGKDLIPIYLLVLVLSIAFFCYFYFKS